jgi:hypothetical protein
MGKHSEGREKRKRWVRRGRYAVEVEVDVLYPAGDPSEPCLEPATVRWLDEVARRAEHGDVAYLFSTAPLPQPMIVPELENQQRPERFAVVVLTRLMLDNAASDDSRVE